MLVEEGELLLPDQHAVAATMDPSEGTPGLGRLVSIDHRDRLHMMSIPRSAGAGNVKRKHWLAGRVLDQGPYPHCVAYSGQQYLVANPVKNKPYKDVVELYKECQLVDEWPGEGYDGTSVRALFKVLQAAGYIKEYKWAFDIETVVNFVLTTGPVVFGTNWYEGMSKPNCLGFIRPAGALTGGHAYLIKGADREKCCPDNTRGALRMVNSWGEDWGEKGHAWISFRDADRLIKEWGEACTAIEQRVKEDPKAMKAAA